VKQDLRESRNHERVDESATSSDGHQDGSDKILLRAPFEPTGARVILGSISLMPMNGITIRMRHRSKGLPTAPPHPSGDTTPQRQWISPI
jgi:hypothetical protein